jgi:hypothetical protein
MQSPYFIAFSCDPINFVGGPTQEVVDVLYLAIRVVV